MKNYFKPEISILSISTVDVMTGSGIFSDGVGQSVNLDWDSLETGI